MLASAIIVAGGLSKRFGGEMPKQFCLLGGKPMLSWTIEKFEQTSSIDTIVLVVPEGYEGHAADDVIDPFQFSKVTKVIPGGDTRQQSVMNGLNALAKSTKLVAIHDGARPLIAPVDIERAVAAAVESRAAIIAAPVTDTIKRVGDRSIVATLDRSMLYAAQTPQVFDYEVILRAHAEAGRDCAATDDAELVERLGFVVQIIEPSSPNLKITTEGDMLIAEALIRQEVAK